MDQQLWRQFPQVAPELNALQPYLLDAVKLANRPIHSKILALLESGGKFLRPGYFYLPPLANQWLQNACVPGRQR